MDALLGHNYDHNKNLEPSASIYKLDTEKWYRLTLISARMWQKLSPSDTIIQIFHGECHEIRVI